MPEPTPAVRLTGVVTCFGDLTAVDHPDLTVPRGVRSGPSWLLTVRVPGSADRA